MKIALIRTLTETFEGHAQQTEDGLEYWLARDLQQLLGYSEWRNFTAVTAKARTACESSGHQVVDHFVDVNKTIAMPKGAAKEVPDGRSLADFAPTIILKAKDFAAEITVHNARTHQMAAEGDIASEHTSNNAAVRETLLSRGIRPESLTPAEDVKKVERRITSEEKAALKDADPLRILPLE